MATVNLGRIKFVWQGAYSGATAYVADDVVSYNGSSYICILASTNNLPTNTTYWSIMSSAGTNGTDVGTTLTTQGDILYRNASGLVRLGAGTSGQVLTTAGSGANPSWSTVSSDFVKLAETDASNVSSVSLNGYFTSNYDIYKIFIDGVYSSSNNIYSRITFNTTGSYTEQTSGYYYVMGSYRYNIDDSTSAVFDTGENTSGMNFVYVQTSVSGAGSAELTLYNPMSTTYKKMVTGNVCLTHSEWTGASGFAGYWDSTTAITGIRFKTGSGNIYARKIRLYGIKN